MDKLDLIENLVYVIFGSPLLFGISLIGLFAYFSAKSNLSKWANILFFSNLVIWIAVEFIGDWLLIIFLIIPAFLFAWAWGRKR